MLDTRRYQAPASASAGSAPGGHAAAGEPARPSPYDLYIDFQEVAALWACETEHADELLMRCAFQSIEMGLGLLADTARDTRPAANREGRLEALADNLVAQVALARRLVRDDLPPKVLVAEPAAGGSLRPLRRFGARRRFLVGRVTDAFLVAGFPVPVGLEPEVARLRAHAGLPEREGPKGPFAPYDRWVQPERVAALVGREVNSPEDRLFVVVHQMTECWLRLVLDRFRRAEAEARRGSWDRAAAPLEEAGLILEFLGRHIELLHLMVVADYHPLRVALRGASGAQSAAARVATISARHMLPPLLADLGARGLGVVDVFRFPHEHPGEHRYLEAVGNLERRLTGFYFQHFQLARKVLGTQSLGSLGYEVRALADRFIKPMFQELDDARFDHTMLTNVAHGNDAGHLIAEREGPLDGPAPAATVDPQVVREVLGQYFDAIRAFDLEAWVATLDPQASLEDPVGSRPHRGAAELRVFFTGVMRTFRHLDVTPGLPDLHGSRATVRWQARGTAYNGRAVAFEGTEIFDLAADGRIVAVRVVWDPRVLVDQLLAPAPATPPDPPSATA